MGNPRIRGLIFLVAFLAIAAIFCGVIPFIVMPGAGSGVALPVIEVPGEIVIYDLLPGFDLTNTIIGTLATNVIVLLIVFILWRVSRGWTNEVPGRLQGMFEAFTQGFYNFCEGIGGERLRGTPMLWPLVATIFLFLLTANYMKLLPGVETVGKMHCAYAGQSGYAMTPGWTDGSYRLWVDEPLNAGHPQTEETEAICNDYFKYGLFERFEAEDVETIEARAAEYQTVLAGLPDDPDERSESQEAEYREARAYVDYADARIASAQAIVIAEGQLEAIDAEIARLEAGENGEEAADNADNGENGEAENGENGEADDEEVAVVAVAMTDAERDGLIAELESEREAVTTDLNEARTQIEYPGATLIFTPEQLETGAVPYRFHITPFVRGPATDLSLTFALAIFSIIAVQIYGVYALGPAYFEKFINLSAIGNAGKRPLGIIDFVVGLIEIISEIGKVVSLAFRLFGNLFAGGVALMAMTFLVAIFVPGIILVLELIIGAVQALVFAVLTLVFSVQAMEAHHGDHDDHHHDHPEESYYDPEALEGGDDKPVVAQS